MATKRTNVPTALKKRLRREAGDKCANPGCSVRRTQIHHIREWAVYQTHDPNHMIAVCGACHDAIHYGSITLTDAVIYGWRKIARRTDSVRNHIYIEPGPSSRVRLGTIEVESTKPKAVIFDLDSGGCLKFVVKDGEILLLDVSICDIAGKQLVSVTDNHVKHLASSHITCSTAPGRIEFIADNIPAFVPEWTLIQMRRHEPDYCRDGMVTLLSLAVEEPGAVRIKGLWTQGNRATIATDRHWSLLHRGRREPVSLISETDRSTIVWDGPISTAMIQIR